MYVCMYVCKSHNLVVSPQFSLFGQDISKIILSYKLVQNKFYIKFVNLNAIYNFVVGDFLFETTKH
jgi:hypothetical protein